MPTINAIGTPQITLGGTFTMSGAYTFIGQLVGNTNVTFPTSGTLATTGGTVQSIQGTANQVLVNGTSGTPVTGTAITLTTPQNIATSSNVAFLTGLFGSTTSFSAGFQIQAVGVIGSSGHIAVASYNNSGNFANFDGYKSASATVGVFSAVSSTEPLMSLNSWGDDGTQFTRAATIQAFVDGTVSSGIVPGKLIFNTANASGIRTLGMTLNSSQVLILANALLPASGGLGTATAPSAGQIPIGNSGGTYTPSAINSGTNITVANGSATITVNLSGIIAPTLGGTGVNNGSNTLTLAGTLSTSGVFSSTFTMTGATNVTFPTSGTLATTAGTVSSVSGTANRITSTGGTTPVIDISSSYVGQSSITTLGTIATGIWQGTLVGATYGGTGINNGSNTLTLAGTLATSGAFATVFTMTGATNVTFPTSGTLLTSAGAVTSITGTVNQVIASASTGPVTLSLPQSISTSSNLMFGSVAFSSTSGIIGTTTNDSAATGSVGEIVSSNIVQASAVSVTSGSNNDITSISLTAGDWDVYGDIYYLIAGGALVQYIQGWVNNASISSPDASVTSLTNYGATGLALVLGQAGFTVPTRRFSLASTTSIYLSCAPGFTVGTMTACGLLFARRRR